MKVILVCGSRDFCKGSYGPNFVHGILDAALTKYGRFILVQGEEPNGVDACAREWAKTNKLPHLCVPAEWTKYGNAAGPIRNKEMLIIGKPDLVIAFPGNNGTANMIKQARQANILVYECKLKSNS